MPLTGVDHLAFTVSDLDRSVEWYCVNLGFEPFVRYTNEQVVPKSKCSGTSTCQSGSA